jgi:succinoglycan biosynthesis protein ExoV
VIVKLIYTKVETGNFGDDINTWLWKELLGKDPFNDNKDLLFFGIGSILADYMLAPTKQKVILGSGSSHERVEYDHSTCKTFWVRGPRSATAMDLPLEKAISDSAYLVLDTNLAKKTVQKRYGISIIPHHQSLPMIDWHKASSGCGMHLIEASSHYLSVIEQIRQSELVITESLHGAIIADAFRIPWIAIDFSYRFSSRKWFDWAESIRVSLNIVRVPTVFQGKLSNLNKVKNFLYKQLGEVTDNPRWKKRPYKYSTPEEMLHFIKILKEIPEKNDSQLSNDEILDDVLLRMRNSFEDFKSFYNENTQVDK